MNATISRRDAGVVLAAEALAASTAGRAAADVDVASAAVDLYARMTARDPQRLLREPDRQESLRCCFWRSGSCDLARPGG